MKYEDRPCGVCGKPIRINGRQAFERRKYCGHVCYTQARAKAQPQRSVDAFWRNVNKTEGCWEWKLKPSTEFGYCKFSGELIHRYSWRITHGEIPDGLQVCHKCDNPKCCRPDHLFLGTQKDNVQDMMRKGRHKPSPVYGDSNHWTRAKDADVAEIRRLFDGGMVQRHIAKRFNLSPAQVCRIVNRKSRTYDASQSQTVGHSA